MGYLIHCWHSGLGLLRGLMEPPTKAIISPIQCRLFYNSKWTTIRILVKFLFLGHVLHPLLQGSDAAGPVLSLLLALAEEIQALAGPFEDHGQTPALRYRADHLTQRLRLATLADALHFHDRDWGCVRGTGREKVEEEEERTRKSRASIAQLIIHPVIKWYSRQEEFTSTLLFWRFIAFNGKLGNQGIFLYQS